MATTQSPVNRPVIESLEEFTASVSYGSALIWCLRAAGSEVEQASRTAAMHDTWILVVKMGELLELRFRVIHALLLVGADIAGREVLREFAARAEAFHDEGPALFATVSSDTKTAILVSSSLLHHEAQHIRWVWWNAERGGADGEWVFWLHSQLRDDDVFDERNPVPIAGGVLRRRNADVFSLVQSVEHGRSLGCFGLRKVGKTTLLRHVIRVAELRSRYTGSDVGPVWIDVQGLPFRTLHGLCDAVVDALTGAPSRGPDPLLRLDAELTSRAAAGRPTWIVLDEYDLLFANAHGRGGVEGIERFFSLLRAHGQRHHHLSLVVIGRDPTHAQRPTMEGAPNPLLGWLSTHHVGPLAQEDARALFTALARRVCLDAGPATIDTALHWSGGHPMLLRQFGSALLSVARKDIAAEGPLPTDPYIDRALDAFLERDVVLEMCREVEHLLADVYPDAATLLWGLVDGLPDDSSFASQLPGAYFERNGSWRTPAAQALRNLGLLLGTAEAPVIPELWRWWSSYVTSRPHASTG